MIESGRPRHHLHAQVRKLREFPHRDCHILRPRQVHLDICLNEPFNLYQLATVQETLAFIHLRQVHIDEGDLVMAESPGVHGVETAQEIAEDLIDNKLTLKRGFTLPSVFALAFSDISPIVSIYTVFGIIVAICGAGFWLAMPIVLVGQLLIAGVFGDVASRFPLAGSVYQWSRQLVGPRYGWFTAWAYIWGLTIALATLTYGAQALAGRARRERSVAQHASLRGGWSRDLQLRCQYRRPKDP